MLERVAVGSVAGSGRQAFMSREMWFTWLLRADVRGGAQPGNAAAQREFVAWWILSGPAEYPNVWSIGEEALAVAMEAVFVTPTHRLPRLLRELYRRRPDLQQAFPLMAGDGAAAFLSWYRVRGAHELLIAPGLPAEFEAVTERPSTLAPWGEDRPALPWVAVLLHQHTESLARQFNGQDLRARQHYAQWFAAGGAALLPIARTVLPTAPRQAVGAAELVQAGLGRAELGVNLVGYPKGEFGIGEDIRCLSAALAAAEVPHVVIDLERGSLARQQDETLAGQIGTELVYGITIFCQSAFDMARVYLERGPAFFEHGITIGNWPWELARFPAAWSDVYGLVTEVWAASAFSLGAYAENVGKQACLMPPAVSIGAVAAGKAARPAGPYVFFCAFDPNSSIERKNPVATIRAFRRAFPLGNEAVRLVLRVNGAPGGHGDWPLVADEIGEEGRIEVAEGTLSRAAFLGEMRKADCLVSSHRGEGFGRNIAEAILLGVPVLATGYSGCMDFLQPGETIRFSMRGLGPQDYPYGGGLEWADPDVADLAERMRQMVSAGAPGPERAGALAAVYSVEAAGERYRRRLARLHKPVAPPRRRNAAPGRMRMVT